MAEWANGEVESACVVVIVLLMSTCLGVSRSRRCVRRDGRGRSVFVYIPSDRKRDRERGQRLYDGRKSPCAVWVRRGGETVVVESSI